MAGTDCDGDDVSDFTPDETEEIRKRLGCGTDDLVLVVRKALESIRTYETALSVEVEKYRQRFAYGSGPGTLAGDDDL